MSTASTVTHLQHKLELVEASRRRYQKAALSGSQAGEAMVQLTSAQLSDAEDSLARLQAEHQEALQRTEVELCDLRGRCAALEAEQQAEIHACPADTTMCESPQTRKAYLVGKTEGQREAMASHAKIASLSQALDAADKEALSANVQLLEMRGKYHQVLQDKVKLQRQLRELQDKLHEIHLQQAETLSSVINNTTRADQMNRRVWERLDKALNSTQFTAKSSPSAVAMLTAENSMLRDAQLSSMDSAGTQAQASRVDIDSVTSSALNSNHASIASMSRLHAPEHDAEGATELPAAVDQISAVDAGDRAGSSSVSEPITPSRQFDSQQVVGSEASSSPADPDQKSSRPVSFTSDVMFNTLTSVLLSKGVRVPKQPGDGANEMVQLWSGGTGGESSSSGSSKSACESEWSGDDLVATHAAGQTNRVSSSSCQVESLSGMLNRRSGSEAATLPSCGLDEKSNSGAVNEESDFRESFSRSSLNVVTRRDSVELSRQRLARRFKAPALALGACSYLRKLVDNKGGKDGVKFISIAADSSKATEDQEALVPSNTHNAELKSEPAKPLAPGSLWAALKQKGSKAAVAATQAVPSPGLPENDSTHDQDLGNTPSNAVAPTGPRVSVTEQVTDSAGEFMEDAPPTAPPRGNTSLSGHVSPVQSLSSTASGLNSRVGSPDGRRFQGGQLYDQRCVGVSPTHNTMRAIESISQLQDSNIAGLEEQVKRLPSCAGVGTQCSFEGSGRLGMQPRIAPTRTLWERSAWEGPIDDTMQQYPCRIVLHTPLIASQELSLSTGRLRTSGIVGNSPREPSWKSDTIESAGYSSGASLWGVNSSSSRVKQAGLQYAASVMQSSSYKLPREVHLPSAGYALHN